MFDSSLSLFLSSFNFYLHFPVKISFGNNKLPLHGIKEVIAFFIGFRYVVFLKKMQGDKIESENSQTLLFSFGKVIHYSINCYYWLIILFSNLFSKLKFIFNKIIYHANNNITTHYLERG